MVSLDVASRPLRALVEFFALALDTLVSIPRRPFAWREFLIQSWFVARVSVLPTLLLSIPFTVLAVFTLNILLIEFGAADYSGSGAAFGAVTQIGPLVTVLVVAGAAICSCSRDSGIADAVRTFLACLLFGYNKGSLRQLSCRSAAGSDGCCAQGGEAAPV